MKRGPKTKLNGKLLLKIRSLVLEGHTQEQIAEICEIPFKTIESWMSRNYKDFADKWRMYKQEWRLKKAEENVDEFLEMDTDEPVITMIGVLKDKDGKVVTKRNTALVKIKSDMSQFVAETLGKNTYSKKQEIEHKGGQQFSIKITTVNPNPHGSPMATDDQADPSVATPDGQHDQ